MLEVLPMYSLNLAFSFSTITSVLSLIVWQPATRVKKNNKLSQYIGKTSNNLKIDLGKPDEDFKNEKGNLEFIYNTKKYGIPCERKFEIDSNSIVIGFISNGCF